MDEKQLVEDYRKEQDKIMKDFPRDFKEFVSLNRERLEKEYQLVRGKKEVEMEALKQRFLDKIFDNSDVKSVPHGKEIFDMLMTKAEAEESASSGYSRIEDIIKRYRTLEEVATSSIKLTKG